MSETGVKNEPKKCAVPPFAVEIDHHRNCDCLIQGLHGMKLRSRQISARPVFDKRSGRKMIPPDQASGLGQYPEIPGEQLHLDPARCFYRCYDPLVDDKETCKQIKQGIRQQQGYTTQAEITGVPERTGTLDKHRFKTLVREVVRMVEAKEARVIKGILPDMEDVDGLDGKYLLNPGSVIQNYQPKFEEDYEAFAESLNRVGG